MPISRVTGISVPAETIWTSGRGCPGGPVSARLDALEAFCLGVDEDGARHPAAHVHRLHALLKGLRAVVLGHERVQVFDGKHALGGVLQKGSHRRVAPRACRRSSYTRWARCPPPVASRARRRVVRAPRKITSREAWTITVLCAPPPAVAGEHVDVGLAEARRSLRHAPTTAAWSPCPRRRPGQPHAPKSSGSDGSRPSSAPSATAPPPDALPRSTPPPGPLLDSPARRGCRAAVSTSGSPVLTIGRRAAVLSARRRWRAARPSRVKLLDHLFCQPRGAGDHYCAVRFGRPRPCIG